MCEKTTCRLILMWKSSRVTESRKMTRSLRRVKSSTTLGPKDNACYAIRVCCEVANGHSNLGSVLVIPELSYAAIRVQVRSLGIVPFNPIACVILQILHLRAINKVGIVVSSLDDIFAPVEGEREATSATMWPQDNTEENTAAGCKVYLIQSELPRTRNPAAVICGSERI